jgi:exodeoxyribonuclease V beta subunit
LLGGGEPLAEGLETALDALRGDCEHIAVVAAPEPTHEQFEAADAAATLGSARESRPVVTEPWWIASYSAIRTVGRTAGTDDPARLGTSAETPTQDRFQEMQAAQTTETAIEIPSQTPVRRDGLPSPGSPHAFPRGPEAGTFLHDLLEWCATNGFSDVAAAPALLRDTVARRCRVRGWSHWIDPLTAWILQLITRPLQLPAMGSMPATRVSLAGLASAVPEMEFWIAAHRVDTLEIDRLVCAHTLDQAPRPALQSARLNGMLKGFMDLVFEHEGRYYVADYKSNWLGPDAAAYTPAAMRAEILHARYELQYVLYLFALHRLLKARLPDYDYDRHVGGAVYLFLRGVAAPSQGLHAERPPRELIESLDRCFARSADRTSR